MLKKRLENSRHLGAQAVKRVNELLNEYEVDRFDLKKEIGRNY